MKLTNTLVHRYKFAEGFNMCCHRISFHSHVNTKLTKENRSIIRQLVKKHILDCLKQNVPHGYFHYNEKDLNFIGQWYILGRNSTDEETIDEGETPS